MNIHHHSRFKLGRKPRAHDPRIPHLSALLAGKRQAVQAPKPVDWTNGMPSDLGAMLNNEWGCCTISGVYHGVQVWSFNATGHMLTEPDSVVLKSYEVIDGFDPHAGPPGSNPTDQGGIEQHVLKYWLNKGVPMSQGVNKCAAFVEIDPNNDLDVNLGIAQCGFVYIGFSVPAYIMPQDSVPPLVWDVDENADNTIIGGHAVVVPGFAADNVRKLISWGSYYRMTDRFWKTFVDECYCIADLEWINAKKMTPAGLSMAELEQQMQALRQA